MRVKINDTTPGAAKLPDDWHVPDSLKPRRELTRDEQITLEMDVWEYTKKHIQREERRKNSDN